MNLPPVNQAALLDTAIQSLLESAQSVTRIQRKINSVYVDIAPGEVFSQGDVGVVRLATLPKEAMPIEAPRQGRIVPGTTSHNVEGDKDGLDWYRIDDDHWFPPYNSHLDSLLALISSSPWTLNHPKHLTCHFPEGIYRFYRLALGSKIGAEIL